MGPVNIIEALGTEIESERLGLAYSTANLVNNIWRKKVSTNRYLITPSIRTTIITTNTSFESSSEDDSWTQECFSDFNTFYSVDSFQEGIPDEYSWTENYGITYLPYSDTISPKNYDFSFLGVDIKVPSNLNPYLLYTGYTGWNSFEYDFSNITDKFSKNVVFIQTKILQLSNKYKEFRDFASLLKIKNLNKFQRIEFKDLFKKIRRHLRKGINFFTIILSTSYRKIQLVSFKIIRRLRQLKMISKGSIDEDARALVNSWLTGSNVTIINHLIYLYHEPQGIYYRKTQRNY